MLTKRQNLLETIRGGNPDRFVDQYEAFSMHYIRYDVLYAYVLARLQYWSMMVQKDEDKLLKRLLNASDRERNSAKKKQAAELKKAEKRKAEVDGLFAKCMRTGLPDA